MPFTEDIDLNGMDVIRREEAVTERVMVYECVVKPR